ncbi:MAG: hypothetical protein JNN04_07940 [Cyclobacteriaceae bacterium]|nr:hypothetical protein [Cyclobacteriaceae bacterium]
MKTLCFIVVTLLATGFAGMDADQGLRAMPRESVVEPLGSNEDYSDCEISIKGTFDDVEVDLKITIDDVSGIQCLKLKMALLAAIF